MKNTRFFYLWVVIGVFGFVLQTLAAKGEYKFDVTHSNITFKVKHLVVSTVSGRFNKFDGSLMFDDKSGSMENLSTEIEAKSIDTNNEKRDNHLRNSDFFDTDKFPKITFKSTKIEIKNKVPTKIYGTLTMRGVSKPVVFDVEFGGTTVDSWGNEKLGLEATAKINRKDFGVSWNQTLDKGGVAVSDEVTVIVDLAALKKKS